MNKILRSTFSQRKKKNENRKKRERKKENLSFDVINELWTPSIILFIWKFLCCMYENCVCVCIAKNLPSTRTIKTKTPSFIISINLTESKSFLKSWKVPLLSGEQPKTISIWFCSLDCAKAEKCLMKKKTDFFYREYKKKANKRMLRNICNVMDYWCLIERCENCMENPHERQMGSIERERDGKIKMKEWKNRLKKSVISRMNCKAICFRCQFCNYFSYQ